MKLGRKAEEIVLSALNALGETHPRPPWMISARFGTTKAPKGQVSEDSLGGDLVIETTDVGTLMLQVKSSARYHRRQHRKYQQNGIPVIIIGRVISENLMNEEVRYRIQLVAVALLSNRRKEILEKEGGRSQAAA